LHSANAEDVVVSKANKPAIASLSSPWLSALAIGLYEDHAGTEIGEQVKASRVFHFE